MTATQEVHKNSYNKIYYQKHKVELDKKRTQRRHVHYAQERGVRMQRMYGLSQKQYEELYLKQLGLCAICHDPFGDKTPYVDHDHKTNKVRGLVHHKCNLGLGHFDDDPKKLQYALWYLEEHAT